jgi:hypothetical protein
VGKRKKRDTSHILINGNRIHPHHPSFRGQEIEIVEGKRLNKVFLW